MGMPVALGNGVKVDKGSASRKSDSHRIRSLIISVPVSMKKTADWRAVCGKTARTVRREGRAKPVPTPIAYLCGFAPVQKALLEPERGM
uniref:Uncharacterized protein n=1 Tax=Candidatus Kentrum sp. LPFa TaxID=2126335 RepID=A0A450Y655_9GAMM|nr:MAG: hypothetical protein BECKLPF1236A_GA0070988_106272 [Candidatus Kentron sp. LPFa]VFK37009.1 MAG: hypothetical protein BECKLPF1236C_GA0070990_107431 [Candidatus Kentron sp. LPFa]